MATIHSYARFSTTEQGAGDSERRQMADAQSFAQRHKCKLSNLSLLDRGRSGFRGDKQKALRKFLAILKDPSDPRVSPGDILLVEAVDRLSRKGIRATQTLVNEILDAGVDIAILSPIEKIYRASDANDIGGAIELAAFAYQAWIYSENLSQRISKWHEEQRRKAIETGSIISSGPTPAWLIRKDGSFQIVPEMLKAIQYAFARTIAGVGAKRLVAELNARFPSPLEITGGKTKCPRRWNETYLRQIVTGRTVLGEYQPNTLQGPEGQPILDYYPCIIDSDTWAAAQEARANRLIERGPNTLFTNLFTGLVFHAEDNCSVHVYTFQQTRANGQKVIIRRLKSSNATNGIPGANTQTVDLEQFEQAVLYYLRELDASILDNAPSRTIELQAKQGELLKKQKRLAQLKQKALEDDATLDLLVDAMKTLQSQIETLQAQVKQLQAQARGSNVTNLDHLKALAQMGQTNENRQKLREAIKRVVSRIEIATIKLGTKKNSPIACLIELQFRSGTARRIILCKGQTIAYSGPQPQTLSQQISPLFLAQFHKSMMALFS